MNAYQMVEGKSA